MDIPSLKKTLVTCLLDITGDGPLKGNKLILATAAGMIIGEPISDEDVSELKVEDLNEPSKVTLKVLTSCAESCSEGYKKAHNVDYPLSGNDGYVVLKNATLKTLNAEYVLASFIVFYDQIIGVSIGNP